MITDIQERSRIGPNLNPANLEAYWNEYFLFRDQAPDLHELIEEELILELDEARQQSRPFLDSQQTISRVLTKLGSTGRFHRQFGEQFPEFRSNQVLGMQLYALIAADVEIWVYTPIQHDGHLYSHASYFLPRRS